MQSLPPIKYSYTTHGAVIIICIKVTKLTNPPRLLPAYRFAVCLLVCVNEKIQYFETIIHVGGMVVNISFSPGTLKQPGLHLKVVSGLL